MINGASLRAVQAARLNEPFGKPLYDSYCFSRIPATVQHLLTGTGDAGLPASVLADLPRRYAKVVLVFLDALGWRFFERYHERHAFLRHVVREGVVSQLTAQFPSTTAAHSTTIHTGLPVGQSGVYEWYYYEPLLDRIIMPLMFSFAGDGVRDTLRATGVAPSALYPTHTLYQALRRQGVKSYVFQHHDLAFTPFSSVVTAGAEVRSYRTLAEGLVNLARALVAEPEPAYFFLYYGAFDAIAHLYGPGSPQLDAEGATMLEALEQHLHAPLAREAHDTLLLVTADHGQVEVAPDTTIYLNRLAPAFDVWLRRNRRGELLVPAGSPRDMFLHVQAAHLDEAQAWLASRLAGRAEVYRVPDLIAQGYFGEGEPSATFLGRVGDLVILPYAREAVWWYERGRFEQRFYGHHGGLTAEELQTILLAVPYA